MKRQRGATLLELMIFAGMVGVVMSGAAFLTAASFKSHAYAMSRSQISTDVSLTMQLIDRDLQQAKNAEMQNNRVLRVRYGKMLANGTYDCSVFDDPAEILYYLSDTTGKVPKPDDNINATVLWRKRSGSARPLCTGVTSFSFGFPTPGAVDVSLDAAGTNGASFTMSHRSIFMRNFK